jgi:hypothetical protein
MEKRAEQIRDKELFNDGSIYFLEGRRGGLVMQMRLWTSFGSQKFGVQTLLLTWFQPISAGSALPRSNHLVVF